MSHHGPWHLAVQYASTHVVPARAQCRRWVSACRSALADRRELMLTLRFVDAAEGKRLNLGFRGRAYATNVLTFSYDEPDLVAADIVVCAPVIEREARQQKKHPHHHYAHMVVHGVLHAHGFDHDTPQHAARMEALEVDILKRFRVADPYQ